MIYERADSQLMRIMAPINKVSEAAAVIQSGAQEIYCGVMPKTWLKNYTNTASPNRRQWRSANLEDFLELKEVVRIAHDLGGQVHFALNEFYTSSQMHSILEQLEQALESGVDALIIVDLGLLNELRKRGNPCAIHIGTGGTSFNSQTISFYREQGADRIIIPRHVFPKDLARIGEKISLQNLEVFIMNAGCKNIDGMCTFHHGVNELLKGPTWHYLKKFNIDFAMQNFWRRLPLPLARAMARSSIFGHVDACFLSYDIQAASDEWRENQKAQAKCFVASTFDLLTGIDTCGACAIFDFAQTGINLFKIVGRNFTTQRKINDVTFIRSCLDFLEKALPSKEEYQKFARNRYQEIYKLSCSDNCYYPE